MLTGLTQLRTVSQDSLCGTHKWSRNAGLALQFLKLVLEGEIGQNLAKLWQFEVKKPCNVSYQN